VRDRFENQAAFGTVAVFEIELPLGAGEWSDQFEDLMVREGRQARYGVTVRPAPPLRRQISK
jgi:hypothetical protein